ncbi:MerR family transcriptional regulator [Arthrobacter sp. CDRTa11]|uniref:MerR family transcriptional regulator n=1 Tax=Arthrobacter sp. CDRTa11 TaxID=2651199 RepID=UPI002265F765|nr:MerR family transcriptional regulator [Arthrobacter sp. CDRTa11]UZX02651.1 MerR family transcriptional regulator [Arthrobacter sp. CDRTa11]
MKISEVCRQTGVSATTVKYYQREGLVSGGERVHSNQTVYNDSHVQRVKLVRALIDTGGLSVAATKRVLATLDSDDTSLAHTFEAAQHALGVGQAMAGTAEPLARGRINQLVDAQGWHTSQENPGFEVAARTLDAFATIGFEPPDEYLDAYAQAAALIARADLSALGSRTRPDLIAELMVVGTVLGDALIAGLRRLAQQNETADLFPLPAGTPGEKEAT